MLRHEFFVVVFCVETSRTAGYRFTTTEWFRSTQVLYSDLFKEPGKVHSGSQRKWFLKRAALQFLE